MVLVITNFIIYFIELILLFAKPEFYIELLTAVIYRPIYLTQMDMVHTVLTSMFTHGSPWHLLGNVIFLLLFGLPFEDRVGKSKFVAIYLLGGFGAIGLYTGIHWQSFGGLLGASGAIAGIMGGFLVLYPRDEIYMPLGFIYTKAPVYVGVALFMAVEFVLTLYAPPDTIAHEAHLGGLITGAIVAVILQRLPLEYTSKAILTVGKDISSYSQEATIITNSIKLEQLATTNELRELLTRVKSADIPEVRDAWLDKFIMQANCIRCKHKPLIRKKNMIICSKCRLKVSL